MKAKHFILAVVLSASMLSACSFGKSVVHPESDVVGYDKEQLVHDATVILKGKVVSSEGQDDFGGMPVTDFKVRVDHVYKGSPGAEVEVRTQGGENRDMKVVAGEDMVSFEVGEKVVLFLTDEKGERPDRGDFGYFVVGQFQGKFVEENGQLVNKKLSFDAANFVQELKELE